MNINGKYFELVVGQNSFHFIEANKKESDTEQLDLLAKIETVVKNHLKYEPVNRDESLQLSEKDLLNIFNSHLEALPQKYQEQSSKLSRVVQERLSQDVSEAKKETPFLPSDIIGEIANYLSISELGKLRGVDKRIHSQANKAILQRVKTFGYRGEDLSEVATYLKGLHEQVKNLCSSKIIPENYIVFKQGELINFEATMQKLQNLTSEEFLQILSNKDIYKMAHFCGFLIKQSEKSLADVDLSLKEDKLISDLLQKTIFGNNIELLKVLLKHKVKPNIVALALHDVFHERSEAKRNLEMVTFLVDSGADVNAADSTGRKPILKAMIVIWQTKEIIQFLLEKGADPKIHSPLNGMTPLHSALTVEIAKLLIKHGAGVNARNNRGETPLAMARKNHLEEVADYLKSQEGIV